MKGIDFSCVSPASTAICSSMDQYSMVRHGTRTIRRRVGHDDGDHRRKGLKPVPCISQLPIDPKPYNNYQRNRKSSSSSSSSSCKQKQSDHQLFRKSSADINDLTSTLPGNSSRYLLSDKPFVDLLSDSHHVKALVPTQKTAPLLLTSSDSPSSKSSSTRTQSRNQVVELRVSIHCKGCEGKVKKHISRMEGVSSFSIDLATKKVTIIGDVTPLGVLTSISRVKNAELWPSPTPSSSSSSSSSPVVQPPTSRKNSQ